MQFEGKLVQVRAQIWPDVNNKDGNVMDRNWMFGYTYASRDKVHVCHFLPAKFTKPNDLWGQTYFATFFGKVVSNNEAIDLSRHWSPASKRSNVILLIESQSDIQGVKDYLNGPIMLLRLYDQQSGSFVTPE
jgi:hypothetical protein